MCCQRLAPYVSTKQLPSVNIRPPSVVALFQVPLDARRKRESLDMIEACVLPDHETAEVLQGADVSESRHRLDEANRVGGDARRASPRIAEHARLRVVHGLLDKVNNAGTALRSRLGIEAEETVTVLDSRVQRFAVRLERETQEVSVIRAVSHKKRAVWLVC